ncbi:MULTISPECIES: hypothetical protein [Streptomyces]|uniref:Uncharacterized protein n=1 Tax=Streptomyces sp. 900129855 TaxID=3155129 RepID=A0ABV2ZRR6_9ACTN
MTIATTQAPGPDGETTPPAAGLAGDQAHRPSEPDGEPAPAPEPESDAEPEPGPGEKHEKIPAFAIPDLRPYADPKAVVDLARRGAKASRKPAASIGRRALTALVRAGRLTLSGSRTLLSLLAGWASGTYGTKGSIPVRLGVVAAALLGVAHTIADYPVEGMLAVVWGWCLASIATARGAFDRWLKTAKGKQKKGDEKSTKKKPQAKLTKDPAPTPAAAPAEGLDEAPVEDVTEPPLMALVRELIGGDNGVHLQTLRPAMRERLPGLAEATDQELRQVLVAAGWDPSRTFRAEGVAGRAGIHRDQLPPYPFPGLGPGVAAGGDSSLSAAGQSGDSPLLSAPGEGRGEEPQKGRRDVPDGWTEEDVVRGYRWVNDAERGPSAWLIEQLPDK